MNDIILYVFNYVAIIVSVLGLAFSVYYFVKSVRGDGRAETEPMKDSRERIQELLEEFSKTQNESGRDAKKLAYIFGELGRSGYITLHKLTNAGEKNNDEVRMARFSKLFTSESVKKLNNIKGNLDDYDSIAV